ncbi:hypothetical protein HYX07_01440 [Candidatus Woesearchaeota archaeon]|nr:hypothetical protein [Candidatus Woesearchaeota archaeon]
MQLREFISGALMDIINGVAGANQEGGDRFLITGNQSTGSNYKIGTYVDFDVAVTGIESKEEGKKGGIGIVVANVLTGGSKEIKQKEHNENAHRLKFKIFVSIH